MTTSTITFSRPLPGRALEPVSRARADYVFACMKTNGETRRALERCSCSIYVIASILHQMPGPLKRGRTQVAEQNDVTKGSIC